MNFRMSSPRDLVGGMRWALSKWEAHLSEQELKKKLIRIVQEIRGASMSGPNMPAGKALWAAISKTKAERLRAGHAGKVKRLILEVNPAEKTNIDVEMGGRLPMAPLCDGSQCDPGGAQYEHQGW